MRKAEAAAAARRQFRTTTIPEASKGPAGYNIPHFLSIAAIYEFPFGRGKSMLNHGLAAVLLGGWQLNGIAQFRSGQPLNVAVTGDVANIGNDVAWWNYARPNLVGNPRTTTRPSTCGSTPSAFAVPVNSYGNFGKNVLTAPGVNNVDLSLFKKFDFTERVYSELRIESFNTFNIINLGLPNTTFGDPNFGVITSVGAPPRVLQFGLKVGF